jgi:hypothetical protein
MNKCLQHQVLCNCGIMRYGDEYLLNSNFINTHIFINNLIEFEQII